MVIDKIENLLAKTAKKAKTLQFAMEIPRHSLSYSYSSIIPNQKFHSASVGKLMTATLVFRAVELGKLTLETPVHAVLKPHTLDGLFVVGGKDHQQEVTVLHLLSHTAGVNDYFESKAFDGSLFSNRVIREPDTFWKPEALLDYTRTRQKNLGRPGQRFFYSDTGYILLGLLIEEIFAGPFHEVLESVIFKPLGMADTSLCFYGQGFDRTQLAPLYINRTDVHLFTSLSCDFSGGGLSTTTGDLLKFLRGLFGLQLIGQGSLDAMSAFRNKYRQGLYYGAGMMQIRFEEFFFLLKSLPRLQGHLGVTGVHAWTDPLTKASFVLNVGNTQDMVMSFRLLIAIIQMVQGI